MSVGLAKLASVPAGGAVAVSAAAPVGGAPAAGAAPAGKPLIFPHLWFTGLPVMYFYLFYCSAILLNENLFFFL